MEEIRTLFSLFFNMSLTAAIVILIVLFVRLLFRRAPKIYSYILWLVVLLRLLCPVSFSSVVSVFQMVDAPVNGQGAVTYVAPVQRESQKTAPVALDTTKQTKESVHKALDFWETGGIIWLTGTAVLWIYSMIIIIRLKRQLAAAVCVKDNIYLCDYIQTAFVMGTVRPRIYLPTTLTETERQYILLHEQTHIRRCDHIFRLIAFLALSLHWFNPLVWCAFYLSERDMEMSCDEAVMRKMGTDLCASYSASLINLSAGKKIFAGAPLGFGEGNVKCRIKNIMRYKKTAAFITVPVLAAVIFVSVVLGSNPGKTEKKKHTAENVQTATQQESTASAREESPSVQAPVVLDGTVCDENPPILDYVDEKDGSRFVFHCSFGLFVYDTVQDTLTGAVDLGSLDCLDAGGNLDCEVMVSQNGETVYLHPAESGEMYAYDIDSRILTRQTYSIDNKEIFNHLKETADCVNPDYTVWRSAYCVPMREQRYFYLESGSGLLKDIYYFIEQNHETVQSRQIFPADRSFDISPADAAVKPEVELPAFEEAVKRGEVVEYDRESGGTLPGAEDGIWCSVTVGGVEYLYAKYDYDEEKKYQLFSWALRDSSHELENGIKTGMTEQEVLKICPMLASVDFSERGWPSWNGSAYPEHWSDEFDSVLVANIEDYRGDNPPVFLAVMMKDKVVRALTFYEPTAG